MELLAQRELGIGRKEVGPMPFVSILSGGTEHPSDADLTARLARATAVNRASRSPCTSWNWSDLALHAIRTPGMDAGLPAADALHGGPSAVIAGRSLRIAIEMLWVGTSTSAPQNICSLCFFAG